MKIKLQPYLLVCALAFACLTGCAKEPAQLNQTSQEADDSSDEIIFQPVHYYRVKKSGDRYYWQYKKWPVDSICDYAPTEYGSIEEMVDGLLNNGLADTDMYRIILTVPPAPYENPESDSWWSAWTEIPDLDRLIAPELSQNEYIEKVTWSGRYYDVTVCRTDAEDVTMIFHIADFTEESFNQLMFNKLQYNMTKRKDHRYIALPSVETPNGLRTVFVWQEDEISEEEYGNYDRVWKELSMIWVEKDHIINLIAENTTVNEALSRTMKEADDEK